MEFVGDADFLGRNYYDDDNNNNNNVDEDMDLGRRSRPSTSRGQAAPSSSGANSDRRPKTGYRFNQSRLATAHPGSGVGVDMAGSRPYSRSGSIVSVPSGRPMTSSQVGSGYGRPVVPGTASRLLATAMQGRPASRAGKGLQTPVQVPDRPVTQQGLSGLRTATGASGVGGGGGAGSAGGRLSQRQFQDKSYFVGILRAKMGELQSEVLKLRRETESANDEQSTFLAYDKRVKQLAAELTEAQGTLADYNLLVDKLNTDTERAEVAAEVSELRAQNEAESREVEALFAEKQARQSRAQVLEHEIDQERHMADNTVSAMKPELREKYLELKDLNTEHHSSLEQMNQALDTLKARKAALEGELAVSSVKREAVALHDRLQELEAKRDDLLQDEALRGTPAQERERLLQQVKEDNKEIATMERQIVEMREQMDQLNDEQVQLDRDVEDSQSERNTKYRELKKREEAMDNFLDAFDGNRGRELERCSRLEAEIEGLASSISDHLASMDHVPKASRQDLDAVKGDLAFREGELDKSRQTLEGLKREHGQLTTNMDKIEVLEGKIQAELESLKARIGSMEEEMAVYSDLDKLREDAALKRGFLEQEHLSLGARKVAAKQGLDASQDLYNGLAQKLADNETHVQLGNLEKKWSHLEQNNFAAEEYIAGKRAEIDYEAIKHKVLKLQHLHNKRLIDSLKNTGGTHASSGY